MARTILVYEVVRHAKDGGNATYRFHSTKEHADLQIKAAVDAGDTTEIYPWEVELTPQGAAVVLNELLHRHTINED